MSETPRAAGWYADPEEPGRERYWNGVDWTSSMRDGQSGPAARRPSSSGGIRAWWEGASGPWKAVVVAGVVLLLIVIATAVGGATKHHYGPPGAVDGGLSKTCEGLLNDCTSPDAARGLRASDVWCIWDGAHVEVHAVLTNTMAASVNLSIVPKYDIKNGGQHGTSLGAEIPLSLAAGESRVWTGDAGSPEGVAPGTTIGDCKPRLYDIDIG